MTSAVRYGGESLGRVLRGRREAEQLSLRALASELGITASYLSDIEHDRRVPAEAVLGRMAKRLHVDLDELLAVSGRIGELAEHYIRREPMAGVLLRRLAERRIDRQGLTLLLAQVEIL